MPLRTLLTRPATSDDRRRHSSIIALDTESPDTPVSPRHHRLNSLQRLSLKWSARDQAFEPFSNLEHKEAETPEVAEAGGPVLQAVQSHNDIPKTDLRPEPLRAPASEAVLRDEAVVRPQRFSLLRTRHASDPQLSSRFRKAATPEEPLPTPSIITTAPTHRNLEEPAPKSLRSRDKLFGISTTPFRRSQIFRKTVISPIAHLDGAANPLGAASSMPNVAEEAAGFEEPHKDQKSVGAPPAYGDESNSALAIPISRLSDSSRSEGSEHKIYAQTTTTHTISTTTTFFRLRRRKKEKGSLFPLPDHLPKQGSGKTSMSGTPRPSTSARISMSPERRPAAIRFEPESTEHVSPFPSPTHSTLALTNAPFGAPGPSIVRKDTGLSTYSGTSSPSVGLAPPLGGRSRSSTMGSLSKGDDAARPSASGRTSSSTVGRRSFGDLLTLPNRLRQNSTPLGRNATGDSPTTPGSKTNSISIPRELEPEMPYPRRDENDTPAGYLEKLEATVPKGAISTILCKGADEFSKTCLRKYMRSFNYFGESIDMSMRRMLMEVLLPKETQQIDRLLSGFADRYNECNPGIFGSTDEAYLVAFSILLLHSDAHNKNNKRKMTKLDYIKNTQQGAVPVAADVLECFYDNICYTPFIHLEDEIAINTKRLAAPKTKKSLIKPRSSEALRGQVDPYSLMLDNRLDVLRPSLKEVVDTEDPYSAHGAAGPVNINELHQAFMKSAVLQIISARSRPDAFMSQATISNPHEAQAGIVSFKIAKVGLLWRKNPKKKKAQSPWQEWGAVLTDTKLYFFRDAGWVRKLITQYDAYTKTARDALIFKPALSSFEPDALMSLEDAVALIDSSYKKHKNALTFIKHGGFEEIFLANSEVEQNDWVAKLNYAATFRTAGVRMRGFLGTNYEGRQLLRQDSEISTASSEAPKGEAPQAGKKLEPEVLWEINYYRRQLVNERISDLEEKLAATQRELENLVRTARHELILTPIQAKTREALVFAAARMSAKLKWTRVEQWRTKTHRDVLIKDLELEQVAEFPDGVRPISQITPPKGAVKVIQQAPGRSDTDISAQPCSPSSLGSPRRSSLVNLDKNKSLDKAPDGSLPASQLLSSASTLETLPSAPVVEDQFSAKNDSNPESHSLMHQSSVISSDRSHRDHATPLEEAEERVRKEAGLFSVDGAISRDSKRPDTGESERDRIGAISPESFTRDAKGNLSPQVRRSLRGTLRDHREGLSLHHHRSKKARESGSSMAPTEDGVVGTEELKRGADQFILHGKKASVITMSGDWQRMSNEDRLRLRLSTQGPIEGKGKQKAEAGADEEAVEDPAQDAVSVSGLSAFSYATEGRRHSVATSRDGEADFVDAAERPASVYLSKESLARP